MHTPARTHAHTLAPIPSTHSPLLTPSHAHQRTHGHPQQAMRRKSGSVSTLQGIAQGPERLAVSGGISQSKSENDLTAMAAQEEDLSCASEGHDGYHGMCVCVCACVSMYGCMCVYASRCVCVRASRCACVYVCMCVCGVCICACVYVTVCARAPRVRGRVTVRVCVCVCV